MSRVSGPAASPALPTAESRPHLRDYVARVRDRWLAALLAFGLVSVGLVLLGLLGEPVFESSTTIQIDDARSPSLDVLGDLAGLEGHSSTEAEIEVMGSHTVALGAVRLAGLQAIAFERHAHRPLESLLRGLKLREPECRIDVRLSGDVPEDVEGEYELVADDSEGLTLRACTDPARSARGTTRADGAYAVAVPGAPGLEVTIATSGGVAGRRFVLSLRSPESAARWVQKYVVARQVGVRTGIVSLGFEAPTPHLARRVAQALSDSYLAQKQTRKKLQLDRRLAWLSEQRRRLAGQLEEAEERLDQYVTTQGAVLLSERARSIFEEQGRLTIERLGQEQVLAQIKGSQAELERGSSTTEALIVLGTGRTDAAAATLASRLAELEVELGTLQREGKSREHPDALRFTAALAETRERLGAQVAALKAQALAVVERERLAVVARIARVDEEAGKLDKRLATLPTEERRIAELTRDVDANAKALEWIVRWEKEAEIARESALASAYQVDGALLPLSRSRPRLVRQGLVGLFLGLLAAVGLALFLHYLDRTVRTPQQLEQSLGLPLFGAIPDYRSLPRAERRGLRRKGLAALPAHVLPHGGIAESYRTLRANLRFAALERPAQCLAITSAVEQEGKSVTTLNLALVLAQAGARVVVVDADLRRPTAHGYLGHPVAPGLSEVLTRGVPWRDVLRTAGPGTPHLLAAGTPAHNPSALLDSTAFRALLVALRAEFDYVLFDVPPVLAVSDAAAFVGQLDAVLLLARYAKCPVETIQGARDQVRRVGGNLVGCVLNGFDARRARRGTYGAYGSYGTYRASEAPAAAASSEHAAHDG